MFDAPTAKKPRPPIPTALKENLATGVYNGDWKSAGTRDRKRATIRTAKKVFTRIGGFMTEDEFPCTCDDVKFFVSRHLHTDEDARRAGLKDRKTAAKWAKEYCTVLDVASGYRYAAAALRLQNDDWAELIAHVTGQRGAPVVYGNHEMISISSLALRCRERGIKIAQLTTSIIAEIFPTLPKHQQASVLKGLSRLQDLHGSNHVPADLLPNVDVSKLRDLATQPTRVVPPLHPDFEKLMERFLKMAAKGIVVEFFGSDERQFATEPVGEARVKNLRDAVRWLWHGMVVLKLADHETPFNCRCLIDPALIINLIEVCAIGALGPISSKKTRRDRFQDVISFLEWNSPGYRNQIPKGLFSHWGILKSSKATDSDDKRKKRNACEKFVNDKEVQKTFYLMPSHFFDQSKPIIDDFGAYMRADGNGISRKQHRALEHGIMAALTAINTIYCARLVTINRFTVCGDQPNVKFPDDTRADSLVLDIPGRIVKNGSLAAGLQLRPNGIVNPRNILRWFIDDVHPLLLKYKHRKDYCRRPDLLFTGLHVETLRRYWANHTKSIGLDLTPHMCRHFSASLLLDNGASYRDVAVLLGISEAVARENYGFISESKKIQDMMDVQAAIFSNLEI